MTGLQNIIETAYKNLPSEKKLKPWSYINHGVGLLKNEDELNCYLSAYGKMHEEKIHSALSTLTNIEEIFGGQYQVIDWGCGQGLASLCLLDYLKENTKPNNPKKIILIEPSKPAITKANDYLKASLDNNTKVQLVDKTLDDIILSDIKITEPITINFFSNILDIESINLEKLTSLIKSNLNGEQYFICVGPLNATSTRIDEFAKLLNFTEKQIIGKENGKLKTTRGTIKLLVFKIKGNEIQIIKSIYYPPMPTNKNYLHILQKELNKINTNALSNIDKIIEYYKQVVFLEQIKEPAIEQFYSYNYEINESNEIVVDLESNINFLSIFKSNIKEKFPKDLNISIEIEINSKKYAVLNYTYLFDDIKDINTTSEKVKLKLSDFEINYGVLSNFEKSEEEIDEIQKLIKEQNNLENIINVFKEKIDNNLTFANNISFALSSKNPALSQI
ncbi:MAG: hypothetical protein PSX42_17060, partial [bacterium]|nr:hypothetical protein [bacterium]